jgi:L-arabinose isomerase
VRYPAERKAMEGMRGRAVTSILGHFALVLAVDAAVASDSSHQMPSISALSARWRMRSGMSQVENAWFIVQQDALRHAKDCSMYY